MNRTGHETATFFVGGEVEKSPAFSKKTLFVVGKQDTLEIEKHAKEHKVQHIFLGANHSFDASHYTDYFGKTWDDQITYLLDRGYWVTLDYQAHEHVKVLKMLNAGVWQSRLFVPLLSVRVPNVETSSPNLTIKIDDIDFKATNPGVWCLNFHQVTDSNRFTDWTEYTSDIVIETKTYDDGTVATGVAPLPNDSPTERRVFSVDIGDATPAEAKKMLDEVRERMNNPELGLDTTSVSKLKPENEENHETNVAPQVTFKDAQSAADAYTQGTTSDPLSGKISKKVVKK